MKFVSARAFKAAVKRDRKSAGDLVVRKLFVSQPEQADDDLIRFTITTSDVDRERDIIELDGWDLGNYQRNPVVLWAHEAFEPPIGRAVNLFREGEALKSDVRFVPADIPIYGPKAEGIKQLCRSGFLFATSVGFRPLEWDFTEDEARGADDWFPGIDFHRQELMEFSMVSIPANPEALIEPGGAVLMQPATAQPLPAEAAAAEAAAAEAVQAATAAAIAAVQRARLRRQRAARLIELT